MDGLTFVRFVLVVVTTFVSCGDDSTSCANNADCFIEQVCVDGTCVVGDENSTPNNTPDAANNTTDAPNNERDGGVNGCFVDPFSAMACEDDGNDNIGRSIEGLDTQGCDNNDVFTPGTVTISARMCSAESIDKYAPVLIGCRGRAFVAEAIFKPAKMCTEHYAVTMRAQGKTCERQDESDDVECVVDEDGTMTGRFIIRDSRSVENLQITIDKGASTDVEFDYDLTVNVR